MIGGDEEHVWLAVRGVSLIVECGVGESRNSGRDAWIAFIVRRRTGGASPFERIVLRPGRGSSTMCLRIAGRRRGGVSCFFHGKQWRGKDCGRMNGDEG